MAEHFTEDERPDEFLYHWLEDGLGVMRDKKPNVRSPLDRHWAIAITEMEKLLAFWKTWVLEDSDDNQNPKPLDGIKTYQSADKLHATPGDVILVKLTSISEKSELYEISKIIEQAWPNNKVLVVPATGVEIEIADAYEALQYIADNLSPESMAELGKKIMEEKGSQKPPLDW